MDEVVIGAELDASRALQPGALGNVAADHDETSCPIRPADTAGWLHAVVAAGLLFGTDRRNTVALGHSYRIRRRLPCIANSYSFADGESSRLAGRRFPKPDYAIKHHLDETLSGSRSR